jgi:hypothetical protein
MPQISINEYLDFINSTYQKSKYPRIGGLYVFGYLFNQNKKFDSHQKNIKFYDFYPLTFIYNIDPKNQQFTGFNLHKIPPQSQKHWVNLLKKYASDETPIPENFVKLKEIFDKSNAVHKYEMRRVRNFMEIPFEEWSNISNHYANTTFSATTKEIEAKYLKFI